MSSEGTFTEPSSIPPTQLQMVHLIIVNHGEGEGSVESAYADLATATTKCQEKNSEYSTRMDWHGNKFAVESVPIL